MDTDDLSRESYEGIIIEAEKLSHDLTLRFGVLSGDCKNETEYLDKAEKLTKEIMQAEEWVTIYFGVIHLKKRNWNLPVD